MSKRVFDLIGKVCPFCVMHVIREADKMRSGETIKFLVDDPLAIKSVPVELEESEDITLSIHKQGYYWEITLSKK